MAAAAILVGNGVGDRFVAFAGDVAAATRPAPANTPRVFSTIAVIAAPAVRDAGFADLLAVRLGQLPGVRLVERDQLQAAAGELSAANLLGANAAGDRLKLGRLVRADALVVLADETDDDGASPQRGRAAVEVGAGDSTSRQTQPANGRGGPGGAGGRAVATPALRQVQMVIADCRLGARLRVLHLPAGANPAAALDAATAAVRDARDHYPQGVRWIVGTSPFMSRNLTHDCDLDQRRFGALLDTALGSQPGVAVLEMEEARAIGREHALDTRPAGPAGELTRRNVPLIVEGEFEVSGAAAGREGDAAAPTTPESARGASVSFNVTLAEGAGGPGQTIRRSVPLPDVPAFLGQELPAAIFRRAPLADLKPMTPDAQFKTLVDRAGEFARLGAVEYSTPLREAALLLRPTGDEAVAQRRLLADEYNRLTQRPLPAGGIGSAAERAARQQDMHDRAWAASLDHFEYLVRNRHLNRRAALWQLASIRTYTGSVVPDGPPQLKQYLERILPLVRALPPAPPEPRSPQTPAEAEAEDRDLILSTLVAGSNCNRLCWSGGHVMTQEGYDALLDVIDRWAPAKAYPHEVIVGMFGYLPVIPAAAHWSLSVGPAPVPPDAALTRRQIDRQYATFLSRLEHCGKPGYEALAGYARLYAKDIELLARHADTSTPEEVAALLAEVKAFQTSYLGLRVGGKPPPAADPVARHLRDMVADAERVIAWKRSKAGGGAVAGLTSPGTRPATEPSIAGAPPAADNGNRLWLDPLRVRVRDEAGELVDYGTLRARDRVWVNDEHLVACGQDLDVLWNPWTVRLLGNGDVIETGLTLPRGSPLRLRDVKWDGRRLWAATTTDGIWVLDRRGKAVAKIGPDDGLPPADRELAVLPLPDGRVFATGCFGNDNRGWCALIESSFDAAGRLLGRPRVRVIHKGTAVAHNVPPATRPVGNSGLARAVLPADWSYIPRLIGLFSPTGTAAPAAGEGTGPYVLVSRSFDNEDPLVFDLSPGRPPAVALLEAPLVLDDTLTPHFSQIWADSLLELGPAVIARYPLTNGATRGGRALAIPHEPQILLRRRFERPQRGQRSRTDVWAMLPASDGLYALTGDSAFRIDPATFACERIGYDPDLLRIGRIQSWGVSERRGPLMWGDEFCRVVIARDPPTGALEVRTVVGAEGEVQVLWSGSGPTPSGAGLMRHDVRQ